jgi:hypothetical protein
MRPRNGKAFREQSFCYKAKSKSRADGGTLNEVFSASGRVDEPSTLDLKLAQIEHPQI